MPLKMWKHNCSAQSGRSILQGRELCSACGKLGFYDGWQLSTKEKMEAYRRTSGLSPVGPYSPQMPQSIFTCEVCSARGLIDTCDGVGYNFCPACDGTGMLLIGDAEEMEKIRNWASELIVLQKRMLVSNWGQA